MNTLQSNEQNPYAKEKARVKQNFNRAAIQYDSVAVLQREVATRMLDRLQWMKIEPDFILDVGTGTGYCAREIARIYPKAKIFGLDIAPEMAAHARNQLGFIEKIKGRQRFLCGDAEKLPLASNSVDLIVSSLAIQWCNDLDITFAEFRRVLKPGGLLLFSTLGPDTLKELRSAWRSVDNYVHVNAFIDMHDIGDSLVRTHLVDTVMDVEYFTLTYSKVKSLMNELKTLGSRNSNLGRARGLTSRHKLQTMIDVYERNRQDELLPATYEVIYGQTWTPEFEPQSTTAEGEFHIGLDMIGRRRGRRL